MNKKLTYLDEGTEFTYKGYKFTKLADEDESCYCLLNGIVAKTRFGDTNDWAKSAIRKFLNSFDDELHTSKVLPNIHIDDLAEVELNYSAYGIPNGRAKDRITLLSCEEWYWYYFILDLDLKPAFNTGLRSGYRTVAFFAYYLNTDGQYYYHYVTSSYAVRPALHLKSSLTVEVEEM